MWLAKILANAYQILPTICDCENGHLPLELCKRNRHVNLPQFYHFAIGFWNAA